MLPAAIMEDAIGAWIIESISITSKKKLRTTG